MSAFRLRLSISVVAWVTACGTAPPPREQSAAVAPSERSAPAVPPPDPCAPRDGKAPAALEKTYTGLARHARCGPELEAIMQEVSRALGVPCVYCHEGTDFEAMTARKRVANWMATELVPSLRKRSGGDIECHDCHAGQAKLLGHPRRRDRAIEWMTVELTERFEQASGGPLYCKTCHGADLGSPAFRTRVILTDHLPQKPAETVTTVAP